MRALHISLWECLRLRALKDDDLYRLQRVLAAFDGRERLLYMLRTELVFGVNAMEYLRDHDRAQALDILGTGRGFSSSAITLLMPDGWFDHNASVLAKSSVEHLIKPVLNEGILGAAKGTHLMEALQRQVYDSSIKGVTTGLACYTWSTMNIAIRNYTSSQSVNDQALAAIALERFFIHHQRYPATLLELTPEFLPSPPIDSLNGKPLGYRQTKDGRYMLWSFGFDGDDDGGKVSPRPQGYFNSLHNLGYKGDWTWQYRPIKP